MTFPELWLIAGPNGAGKTTCVQAKPISELLPADISFYNPDDRTRLKLQAHGYQGFHDAPIDVQTRLFFESADEVFSELQQAIARKQHVGVETVLSSDKYRSLVESTRQENGLVCLIYVALSSPVIAMERVKARVKRGGHGIPDDKIEQRWHRSLINLAWFAQQATHFWVIDNSDSDPQNAPVLLANGRMGTVEYLNDLAFREIKEVLANL